MKLNGKVAVITGGNSGIGLGIAKEFVKQGAKGAIHGRNQIKLDQSQKELGDKFIAIKGDVTSLSDLESLFIDTVEKFGKIDALVVNAGGGVGSNTLMPLAEITEESYDQMADLNLKSAYFTVQKSLPYLNDGASVVMIGSIASELGVPGFSVYCAAKAGVQSLARTFSAELLDRNIRVNVINPGIVDTPVFKSIGIPEADIPNVQGMFISKAPIGRMGKPTEIGTVAAFLASDESSYILGEEINVDGGILGVKQ